MRVLWCTLLLLLAATASYAEASLYLYPKVERGERQLVLSDLGALDGDAATLSRIGAVAVDDALVADGVIDRKEILDLVKSALNERITIYGNGVRVRTGEAAAVREEPRVVVHKGARVRFQVVNANVRAEQSGTAMEEGAVGDVIPVKLKGSAVSRGRIVNERVVELAL